MDYKACYDRLIERARTRVLDGYVERHHILPRCMGGSDDPVNLARLTPEEHYLAHQLLVKMYPGNHSLLWAWSSMTHATAKMPRQNKRYGWLRRRFAEAMRERFEGKPLDDAHRAKLSTAAKTRVRQPHSAEARARISAAAVGRKKSPEHCAALSAARTGKKRPPRTAESKARISAALKASTKLKESKARVSQDPEYRAKQSENMKRIWADRKASRG